MRVRPGQSAGFTLLEVLVAVAILSLSLVSLLGSQMAALRATDQARRMSSVAFLAEWQLTEIEWELRQDGWGVDDQTFDGDFADQGWPDVTYMCTVDLIEMPDYNQLVEAKDAADSDGDGDLGVQDAGDNAFGAMGMVWPIIKEAIEQSIRKSWCTVRWGEKKGGKTSTEPLCGEDELDCFTIATFWTDPNALKQLPALGGESDETDDVPDDGTEPGGPTTPGGGGGDGGRGGGTVNPSIPTGPSGGGIGRGGMK